MLHVVRALARSFSIVHIAPRAGVAAFAPLVAALAAAPTLAFGAPAPAPADPAPPAAPARPPAAAPVDPRMDLLSPIRILQFDDGRFIRQVVPLKEMSRAEIRETLSVSTRLLSSKIVQMRSSGALPRELTSDTIGLLQSSRAEIERLLSQIEGVGLDRYARSAGLSAQDFIPGAIFVGFGISAAQLPPSLQGVVSRIGGAGGGSLTVGVVVVPRYVRMIDKLCTEENPNPRPQNSISFDYSFIALPNVNLRGLEANAPAPVASGPLARPTIGLIWGPNVTGAIYSASQVAGLFAGVSASLRWGPLGTSIFSRFAPSGLNGKFGVIGSSSGFLPVTFIGAEYGGGVGGGAHLSVAAVVRLSALWDAFTGAFGLTGVSASPPRLDGIVDVPSRLTAPPTTPAGLAAPLAAPLSAPLAAPLAEPAAPSASPVAPSDEPAQK